MTGDIRKIFAEIEISYDLNQEVSLNRVEVDQVSNTWFLFLDAKELISVDYYEEILNKFSNYLKPNKVILKLRLILQKSFLEHQDQSKIIGYFNYFKKNDKSLHIAFDHLKIEVLKNKIIFDITSEFDKSLINKNMNRLTKAFGTVGINNIDYDFNLVIEEHNEKLEEIQKKREEEFSKHVVSNKKNKMYMLFGDDLSSKKVLSILDIIDPDNMIVNATIEGVIYELELRETKKTHILIMMIFDGTSTISVKAFPGWNNRPPTVDNLSALKKGMKVRIAGRKEYDKYADDESIMMHSAMVIESSPVITEREDLSSKKRIELHMHTKMSRNNGISSLSDYGKLASYFGHDAISITDHNIVQAYVDGQKVAKDNNIKVIYGLEANVCNDSHIVFNSDERSLMEETYVVFDLETTGLSANFNKIIEIGAVKVSCGIIRDSFQCFVKIDEKLSEFTTSLTGIKDSDLENGLEIKDALEKFYQWSNQNTLVAHNALFDMKFLARNYERHLNKNLKQPVLDTLDLSRYMNKENTYHSLKILAKRYGVPLDSKAHHRADYDARVLTDIFLKMINILNDNGVKTLNQLNDVNDTNKTRGKHNLIYVQNQAGLRNMYELVSCANTEDIQMEPRYLKSNIKKLKENLIYVGGGCAKSEIVESYLNDSLVEFKNVISQFDFIELNPLSQYQELLTNKTFNDIEQVIEMQKKIHEVACEFNIKIVATGNVHYCEPDMAMTKEILYAKDFKPTKTKKNDLGIEEFVDQIKFSKWRLENQVKNNDQYYKTTSEMLNSFTHFSEELANEFVIENTNYFAELIENLKIIPDELYTPEVKGVDKKLKDMVYQRAFDIYGKDLPEIIIKRLEKEVNSITKYGFSIIYYISHKLVKHSLNHGYLVGSRGSVGSSLVATFMDITEINPLAPHYVCPKCQKSEFILDGSYGSGFDIPIKKCPDCDILFNRDGQDIPFETFLGFEGDKVPDIDLNFSGEFQSSAHDFVRSREELNDPELFDFDHAFRAGTIGTIADKTAYAYVKNYFDLIKRPARKSDISYYLKNCVGIKRTTGQHPGGIIVVPSHREIFEFTPIQFPADDKKQPWRTTHFDFHSIHDNLLKLDILGHDDPTMLKKLFDLTEVDPKYVDIADDKVLELFTSTKSLDLKIQIDQELGTLGVPEFGTGFVMEMLKDTKPSTFSELVQISGLSHGTDVWLGNAKELIDDGVCVLKDVIGCRDDIMVYLMYKGLDPLKAFSIMENVRKGKGLKPDEITIMRDNDVPSWYIDSCLKIKYMFPKAHASAYVLMALRIAYYKVYHPIEYYAAYFSSRVDDFDCHAMIAGVDVLKSRIEMFENMEEEMSDVKKKSVLNSLKMSLEMCARGYSFLPFDLKRSESYEFIISEDKKGLLLPFCTIDGLGEKEAIKIVQERNIKSFSTIEDFKKRTKVKTKSFQTLDYFDVFNGLDEDSQIKLF